MPLLVGYAQDTITPALDRPVYLAGFGQNRRAESVHDDLTARALALNDGQTQLVMVALDLIGLGRHHCQEIERQLQQQWPGTSLLLACTHTHHGPDTIGLWGPDASQSGVDAGYLAELKQQVITTAAASLANQQAAQLRCATVEVAGVAKNGRDPDIRDQELTCLQFCRPATSVPVATWLIFPCHPEVLWDSNTHITSDYIDSLRQVVETATQAPCLVMVGALGGMMTPDTTEHSFVTASQMGQTLAQAGLKALTSASFQPVDALKLIRHEYALHMPNPLFQMAIRTGLLPDMVDAQGAITTEASLFILDDVWLFAVPGELLPKLGLAYKARMKEAGAREAAVIGLVNDETGYILPAEDFSYPLDPFNPGEHYEETMSIGIEAGPRLTAALETCLSQVPGRST